MVLLIVAIVIMLVIAGACYYATLPSGEAPSEPQWNGARLCVAAFSIFAPALGPPYGFDHLGATSIYSRFCLGVCSAVGVVAVFFVLLSGKPWQRVLAFLLGIPCAFGLYESLSYLSIKA